MEAPVLAGWIVDQEGLPMRGAFAGEEGRSAIIGRFLGAPKSSPGKGGVALLTGTIHAVPSHEQFSQGVRQCPE